MKPRIYYHFSNATLGGGGGGGDKGSGGSFLQWVLGVVAGILLLGVFVILGIVLILRAMVTGILIAAVIGAIARRR